MNDLLEAARAAFAHAYAPYSRFRVGAAVRTASGRIFAGANVENTSYPEGNCAETSAIAAMVTAGERQIVEALVLAAGERPCPPCGGCRQRLAEFAGPSVEVHLCAPEGHLETHRLGDLLPFSFTLEHPGGDLANPCGAGGELASPGQAPAQVVRARVPDLVPRVGLVLGSGLGDLADAIEDATAISYAELPGFPEPSIEGHQGRLLMGRLAGVPVACLQGRVHLYEGVAASVVNVLPRTLQALGCTTLILTNAAGSLTTTIPAGTVALITDHINLLGTSPLVGANDERIGPRFPDMSAVYDPELRARVQATAVRLGLPLAAGVYLATLGPAFETPAEIRAFRALGADLVGMSTVPEAISARHAGLKVLGFSIVTNLAAGMSAQPLSHAETLAMAERPAKALSRLLQAVMPELA